jgi:23S rRNA U2552 (ribose-2'-O)-methylase RlmE/FtsJ
MGRKSSNKNKNQHLHFNDDEQGNLYNDNDQTPRPWNNGEAGEGDVTGDQHQPVIAVARGTGARGGIYDDADCEDDDDDDAVSEENNHDYNHNKRDADEYKHGDEYADAHPTVKRQRTHENEMLGNDNDNHADHDENFNINVSNDSYEEIVNGGFLLHKDGGVNAAGGAGQIRQTWMDRIRIYNNDGGSSNTGLTSSTSTSYTFQWFQQHNANVDVPKDKTGDVHSTDHIDVAAATAVDNQIQQAMHEELNELKRELMPTAEACAEAAQFLTSGGGMGMPMPPSNNKHSKKKSSNTTSASQLFVQARRQGNPFECLGEGNHTHGQGLGLNHRLFVNRSAIKLANMDAMLGFTLLDSGKGGFGDSTDTDTTTDDTDVFTFCDLCGAPGGFSEYLFYRAMNPVMGRHKGEEERKQRKLKHIKGYGMSLKGKNDNGKGTKWQMAHLSDFYDNNNNNNTHDEDNDNAHAPSCEFKVCHGQDKTGDIYNWDNVECLKQMIADDVNVNVDTVIDNHDIDHSGLVHLVVADGGFDAQRDCDDQEGITFELVACQIAAGLCVLKPGGTLIIKIFGTASSHMHKLLLGSNGDNTSNTISNISISQNFDQWTIVKPVASRPASAERYLICRGFRGIGIGSGNCHDEHESSISNSTRIKQWRDKLVAAHKKSDSHKQQSGSSTSVDRDRQDLDLHQSSRDQLDLIDLDIIGTTYLNQSERAMVALNTKACHAILSTMEAPAFVLKAIATSSSGNGNGTAAKHTVQQDELFPFSLKTKTLIRKYRQGWKLG